MFSLQQFLFWDGRYSGQPIFLNQYSNDIIQDILFIGVSLIGFAIFRLAQKLITSTFFFFFFITDPYFILLIGFAFSCFVLFTS